MSDFPLCSLFGLSVLAGGLHGCLINTELYEDRRAELLGADPAEDSDGVAGADGGGADSAATEEGDDTGGGAETGTTGNPADADGDGVETPEDCDDADPTVFPGASESLADDGTDNDCDGDRFDAVVWSAADEEAAALVGGAAGDELGTRLGYWEAGGCLLAAAPFAEGTAGAVVAWPVDRPEGVGPSDLGGWHGPAAYTYLANAIDVDPDGRVLLAAPSASDGKGEVWIADAATACDGASADVAVVAWGSIVGGTAGDYLGTHARWLPDLDGDGVGELAVAAAYADGGGEARGVIGLVFEPPTDGSRRPLEDADVLLAGSHDGARLGDVQAAWPRDHGGLPELVFSQRGTAAGGAVAVRVAADDLATGAVDAAATGSILAWGDADPHLTVVGDLTRDGSDELVAGTYTLGVWGVDDLVGAMEEDAAPRAVGWGEDGEWITGVVALGDIDGDGVADMGLKADDWPDLSRRGAFGLLSGADLLPGGTTDFETARIRLEGASAGDSFGYQAVPTADMDGDGRRDLAVVAPQSDVGGTNSGAVFVVPMPW